MKIKQLASGPYDPENIEKEILQMWLKNDYYSPETAKKQFLKNKRYTKEELDCLEKENYWCLINPPPNAYARPHMGNVSGYAYQDVFGRRARMQGNMTLLFPGKDHAAQQAEIVFIRDVLSKENKTKKDFSRKEFYDRAYKHFTGIMDVAQQDEKRIGLSADFTRDLFTLDPRVSASIYSTFEKMWKEKMVYKGVRIVNWSPGLQSAVADIDTERKKVDSKMYYIKYALPQIDPDIIQTRDDFKKGIFKIKVKKILKIIRKNEVESDGKQKLEKLQKKVNITHARIEIQDQSQRSESAELKIWLIGKDYQENMLYEVDFFGMVIPLTNDVNLIARKVNSDEKNKFQAIDSYELTPREYEYIFKSANKLYGSAFIREFKNDDNTPNNEYARGFIIGTVRPETIFGDTAIAVNGEDPRYKDMIGENMSLVSLNGPVSLRIIQERSVDKDFGTGILKVTPAHASTDYKIYVNYNQNNQENLLQYINAIGKDCKLNHMAGKAKGLHAEHDREKIALMLKEMGLLVYQENCKSNITICERTKTVIQPIMSSQWFIDTDKLKVDALEAVKQEKVRIHPSYMKKKLIAWLENLRDWPISRSIWWGYRIPVWYSGKVSEYTDERGQVAVKIGDTQVEDMQDAIDKGLMKLDLQKGFSPILIPGKHANVSSKLFKKIKTKYPWTKILNIKNIHDPSYQDYKEEFKKQDFDQNSVVVCYSISCQAVLDYLLENQIKIKRLILISLPTADSKLFNTMKQKGFWSQKHNYTHIDKLVDKIQIIYSDNDQYATKKGIMLFSTLIKADLIEEKGRNHENKDENINANIDANADSNAHANADNDLFTFEKLMKLIDNYYKEDFQKLHENKNKNDKRSDVENNWIQDQDVFDTWFSSGQWPFACLEAEGLMKFYPTDVMETGFDILELWVSRMIMLGLYTQNQVPFKDVYLHGLIKAEDGQKMSKSKGNIVYTEDIISEFGADTLRMFYIVGNKAGASYRIDKRKIKGYRNFLNKLWNASRFVLMNLDDSLEKEKFEDIVEIYTSLKELKIHPNFKALQDFEQINKNELSEKLTQYLDNLSGEVKLEIGSSAVEGRDLMMLKSLNNIIFSVNDHLDNFRPGLAAEEIIQHFWHIFADIYLEESKSRLFLKNKKGEPINQDSKSQQSRNKALAVLLYCLVNYIKLLHPFVPFITEEIWQHLPKELLESETIMYSIWPISKQM